MRVKKGRVKLFPNVWQALFFTNYTTQRANQLFGEKQAFFKQKAEQYFQQYQDVYLKNVKIIEEYNHRLFTTKTVPFIVEEITDRTVLIYPMSNISKIYEFLWKEHNIHYFPPGVGINGQLPIRIYATKVWSTTTKSENTQLNVQPSEETEITSEYLGFVLLGYKPEKSDSKPYKGVNIVANNLALPYFNSKPGKHILEDGTIIIGKKLTFKTEKGIILNLYGRREYEEFQGDISIPLQRIQGKTIIPVPPTSLSIPPGEFTKSVDEELKLFKFNEEPLINDFSSEQNMKNQFERRKKARENRENKKKETIINKLKEEIKRANGELLDLNLEQNRRILLEQQLQENAKKLKTEKNKIIREDFEKFKDINREIGVHAISSINTKLYEMKKENQTTMQQARIEGLARFSDHLKKIHQEHFEQKLSNLDFKDPNYVYTLAYRIREELVSLLNNIRQTEGKLAIVQRTLSQERIEVLLEDCIKRATRLLNHLQDLDFVQNI